MKRFTDLDDKERGDIQMSIQANTIRLGVDRYEDNFCGNIRGIQKFELCSDCENFQYAKTKYSIKVARCSVFEIRMNEANPIVECSYYEQKYVLKLHEMQVIAYLIDSNPKSKIGLIKDK